MQNSLYKEYLKLISDGETPEFLKKYLTVPSLLRLKNIGYFCGMDYASKNIYNFKEKISRYDHSLTVAILTWKFTKDKKATLSGLFHDIATPCFSHVIDYMNKDYKTQESTEEYTEEIIKKDKTLISYLKADNILPEEIIDFKKYSIVDNNRPKLCTDRMDGIILNSISWTKAITLDDIIEIINDLKVYTNEDKEKELGFKSLKTAKKVLILNDKIDKASHTSEDNFMMELLAKITKKAIDAHIISYEELYDIDEKTLLDKIKNSKISKLNLLLNKFENITKEEIPLTILDEVKTKDLNPLVNKIRLKSMF